MGARMEQDGFWRLFIETGVPAAYMLYRSACADGEEETG